jgi:hypothetical protein
MRELTSISLAVLKKGGCDEEDYFVEKYVPAKQYATLVQYTLKRRAISVISDRYIVVKHIRSVLDNQPDATLVTAEADVTAEAVTLGLDYTRRKIETSDGCQVAS